MEIIAYISICICWGLSSIAIKLGLEGFDVFTFSFFRFFITASCWLVYNLLSGKSMTIGKDDLKVILKSSFFMYFMNSFFVIIASRTLDAGVITIFFCLVPLIMVVAQSILERRLIVGLPGLLGIVGGIVGITIVSLSNSAGLNVDIKGIIFATVGVSSWALGSLYFKTKKISTPMNVTMFYQMIFPVFIYLVVIMLTGGFKIYNINGSSLLGLFHMSVIDALITSSLYMFLIKRWNVSLVATYAYINPIVGLVASYFILSEGITFGKVFGMSIILFSVFLIQFDSHIKAFLKSKFQVR